MVTFQGKQHYYSHFIFIKDDETIDPDLPYTTARSLLPGERDNARNNARCTPARKTTHGLDGQHQDVYRTPRGRVSQNDRGQR